MNIKVCYVYPALDPGTYRPMAERFVQTYMEFPPGAADHEIIVLINGGHPNNQPIYDRLFSPLAVQYLYHDNTGKDIGAFAAAASQLKCDLMVCLGAPIHFLRAGWLDRIVMVYEDNGPGLYGGWGFHQPTAHIRTTAFWLPPEILSAYPYVIHDGNRYEFEHGGASILQFVKSLGMEGHMVTMDGCYPEPNWHHVERSRVLMLDQHCLKIGLA